MPSRTGRRCSSWAGAYRPGATRVLGTARGAWPVVRLRGSIGPLRPGSTMGSIFRISPRLAHDVYERASKNAMTSTYTGSVWIPLSSTREDGPRVSDLGFFRIYQRFCNSAVFASEGPWGPVLAHLAHDKPTAE